jgi:hypothetical protein
MIVGACAFVDLCPTGPCRAADPVQPSPFDKDDPEIAELRKLNWKAADFDKLDARAQCTGYFALNQGLMNLGTKADARLELLIDYIDEQNLGEAFATEKGLDAKFAPATFDELKKVAAAYLQTGVGTSKFGKEFESTSDELLGRYLSLYEKTALREYDEGCESRLQVRLMGLFLERKGKLDEFKLWAAAERKRRQEEFEKQRTEERAAAQQAAQDAKEQAQLAAEERRREKEERAAAQVELAMQQPSSSSSGGYDSDDSWGGSWGYGQGYYYNGNVYRGRVRDKAQDAAQRWRTGRPANLPARRAGGGGVRRR